MSDIAIVHATFADAGEAERISRAMVEQGLAACVNLIGPCTSIYRWEGAVETATEARALFKTRTEQAAALADAIAAQHSYTLPVVEIWPAAVSDAAAQWVRAGH